MIHILAPGPSASQELADRLHGERLIVVGNAYQLAPWAEALVANDVKWWREHPDAIKFEGRKFSANRVKGTELVKAGRCNLNSGTLALIVAVTELGATQLRMHGFDFHGTHFFGPYKNGCSNTTQASRNKHKSQMKAWRLANPKVEVINCTPGSELTCFPFGEFQRLNHAA